MAHNRPRFGKLRPSETSDVIGGDVGRRLSSDNNSGLLGSSVQHGIRANALGSGPSKDGIEQSERSLGRSEIFKKKDGGK